MWLHDWIFGETNGRIQFHPVIVRGRCQKHFFRDDHYTEAVALPYFEVCDYTIFG